MNLNLRRNEQSGQYMVFLYGKMKSLFYIWRSVRIKDGVHLCRTGNNLTKHTKNNYLKNRI